LLIPFYAPLLHLLHLSFHNVLELFKNVHMQGAQKAEPRGVYLHTLSGAVCSATQQMSVFQQLHHL